MIEHLSLRHYSSMQTLQRSGRAWAVCGASPSGAEGHAPPVIDRAGTEIKRRVYGSAVSYLAAGNGFCHCRHTALVKQLNSGPGQRRYRCRLVPALE